MHRRVVGTDLHQRRWQPAEAASQRRHGRVATIDSSAVGGAEPVAGDSVNIFSFALSGPASVGSSMVEMGAEKDQTGRNRETFA